eukprot:1559257-Prymnesium_polylepis.1
MAAAQDETPHVRAIFSPRTSIDPRTTRGARLCVVRQYTPSPRSMYNENERVSSPHTGRTPARAKEAPTRCTSLVHKT